MNNTTVSNLLVLTSSVNPSTPLSANSKNITTNLTVTTPSKSTERIKQARPAPTTSISPTTHEPSNKKLRQETCKLLRHLNINTSRILDISFPGRNIIGLLVHRHYYLPEIISIMHNSKIPVLKDFDPTHPDNLKDPKYKKCSASERDTISQQCHRTRCLRAIATQPFTLIGRIASFFQFTGWIKQADYDHTHVRSSSTVTNTKDSNSIVPKPHRP
ncbi:hypothetical protein BDC45DRAFT_510508 [Circinella umbellata]|nr:hypothetical protein BDC45DRAFT_510508 [Circinella umbellata]